MSKYCCEYTPFMSAVDGRQRPRTLLSLQVGPRRRSESLRERSASRRTYPRPRGRRPGTAPLGSHLTAVAACPPRRDPAAGSLHAGAVLGAVERLEDLSGCPGIVAEQVFEVPCRLVRVEHERECDVVHGLSGGSGRSTVRSPGWRCQRPGRRGGRARRRSPSRCPGPSSGSSWFRRPAGGRARAGNGGRWPARRGPAGAR